ncbi:MAG: hypothetical protein AcusKO_00390 [Acuticoccus sp.]
MDLSAQPAAGAVVPAPPAAPPAAEAATCWPRITVIVVTFEAAGFIAGCLDGLVATGYPDLRILVVDNASPDGTAGVVRGFIAARRGAAPRVELIETGANAGFAAGVNRGLVVARADRSCDLFWILNPDTVVDRGAPFALVREAARMGRFAVIGARVVYLERPGIVQCDGGRLHRLAGTAVSVNIGAAAERTRPPGGEGLAYVPGVSMLASRAFVERAGPMDERYFLYFEEIDWQLRRGDLPLGVAPGAIVHHRAGASIGSPAAHRGASPLSVYFSCRNLLPFVARWAPHKLPFAYAMACYKLVRQWGATRANTVAALRGLHGLAPPKDLRRKLPRRAWDRSAAP